MTDHVAPWRSVYKLHHLTPAEITFVLTSGGHNAGIVSPPGHPRRHYQLLTSPAFTGQTDGRTDPDHWLAQAPSTRARGGPHGTSGCARTRAIRSSRRARACLESVCWATRRAATYWRNEAVMSETPILATAHKAVDPLPTVWDPNSRVGEMLKGKRGLVIGVANADSIAYGCAVKLRAFGADIALTYLNDKAKQYVAPLAEQIDASLLLPLDVTKPGQMQAVFERIRADWGRLDFAIHSIAFAPREDLHGRVVDCSQAGFLQAMQVSCHSFLEMARFAEPLMSEGGSLITMSYYGADKVVNNYNVMGPVKAALEASVRYLAKELGPRNIRVFAVSPGPLRTRAASGIAHFDELIDMAVKRSPGQRLVDIAEIGRVVAFLAMPASSAMTGDVVYIDAGLHNMA